MFDELSPSGQALYMVAKIFGARVTSGKRSTAENASTPGSISNSKHLTGDAIDVGLDAPTLAVSMLGLFGKLVLDKGGTAPHYHVETHELTLPLFIGAFVVGAKLIHK